MKKTIFTFLSALLLFVFANQTLAQVPQGFNYQAVARNSVGVVMSDTTLGIRLSLHQGLATGTVVYSERHTPVTNQFGLFTVSVGQGTWISGTFNTIDWSTGNYYLQVELDATGSTNYTDMGTSQLLTVPYAMYADKVGTSGYTETDPIFIAHPSFGITTSNINNWNSAFGWGNHTGLYRPINWVPAWTDVTGKPTFATVATSGSYNDLINKPTAGSGILINGSNVISANLSLQVSPTGDVLTLNPGNSVYIPGISDANNFSPVVTTKPVNNITSTQAYGQGNVVYYGIPAITETGVCWSNINPQPNIYDSYVASGAISGNFVSIMTGLTANTLYYVRAYAKIGSTPYYGLTEIFTSTSTLPIPTLTTTQITSITTTNALSGGNITANGGSAVTERGVCWSTITGPTIADSRTINGSGNGVFTSSLTGLTLNTIYYVRSYATNANGTAYGPELYFKTDATLPTVTTSNPIAVTESSAILGGNVTSEGSTPVTEYGICLSGSMNPTVNDYKVQIGSGAGAFSSPDACLVPDSIYYVRAYATSSVGTVYGVNKTLTTSDAFYEGFEAGLNTTLWSNPSGSWTLNTSQPQEGMYSLCSHTEGDTITLARTLSTPGNITFWTKRSGCCCWSVSIVRFYIDGIEQVNSPFYNDTWQKKTYPVTTAGFHRFTWMLSSTSGGATCPGAWIDYIIMPW